MGSIRNKTNKGKTPMAGYICFILVFFISAGILAYPAFASFWNERHQAKEAHGYQDMVSELKDEDYSAYWEQADQYNKALLGSGAVLTDPFDYEAVRSAAQSSMSMYNSTLNFSPVMATIEIPKIKVDLPIYHGTDEETLAKGVGHLQGSSLPIGGAGTHSILTGHSGLPGKTLFTDLTKLKPGDVFFINIMNRRLVYQVDRTQVIVPTDLSSLGIEPDKDYATLITCTPYGVNDHRLLVRGVRVFPETLPEAERRALEEKESARPELSTARKVELAAAAMSGLMLLAMLAVVIAAVIKRRKLRKQNEQE